MVDALYQGFRLNSQFAFCPNFMVFDSYQGCSHKCKYCFAYWGNLVNASTLNRGKSFEDIRRADVKILRKVLENWCTNKIQKQLRIGIDMGMPIHWGGMSDPFQPFEKDWFVSSGALKELRRYNHPYVISTKGKLFKEKKYFDMLNYHKENVFQITLIGLNDKVRQLERGADTIEGRLESISRLADAGVRVVVRQQPFILGLYDGVGEIEDYVKAVKDAGASAITTEFFKLTTFKDKAGKIKECLKDISELVKYDVVDYYKYNSVNASTDQELHPRIKYPLLETMKTLCHKHGLEWYSADNPFRLMGDGPICCGYQESFTSSKHKLYLNKLPFVLREKGKIGFREFYGEGNELLNSEVGSWLNIGGRKGEELKKFNSQSWLDLIRTLWNDKTHLGNPARFFLGIKDSMEKDSEGNIIYKYDEDWLKRITHQKTVFDFNEEVNKDESNIKRNNTVRKEVVHTNNKEIQPNTSVL